MPAAGFPLEKIRVGGSKRVSMLHATGDAWAVAAEHTAHSIARFGEGRPAAVFSMGGYVAGPPVLAALLPACRWW